MRFERRTAIVTGGAQGIGGAVAAQLARDGVRVAVWDIEAGLAQTAASQMGNGAIPIVVDIADWTSVQRAMSETLAVLGKADILVNSAGISGKNATVEDYLPEEFSRVQINLMAPFSSTRRSYRPCARTIMAVSSISPRLQARKEIQTLRHIPHRKPGSSDSPNHWARNLLPTSLP